MWASKWLHRRCERERDADHVQFKQWAKDSKTDWGAKNKRIKEEADRRVAEAIAHGRALAAQARDELARRDRLADLLTETPRDQKCMKVRLNDREHAEAMVGHVLETAGVRTEPYACPMCPRQLFGRGRYWHVRTVADPAERAKRDAMKAHRGPKSPDRMALRLPPEQVRLMQERARPDGEAASGRPA